MYGTLTVACRPTTRKRSSARPPAALGMGQCPSQCEADPVALTRAGAASERRLGIAREPGPFVRDVEREPVVELSLAVTRAGPSPVLTLALPRDQ